MADSAEKRRCHRFEIPGGQGKYKKLGLFGFLQGFSGPFPILNVSKGGLAVMCDEVLHRNQKVLVELHAPGREPLTVYGSVRWTGKAPENAAGATCIGGVEFAPFGSRRGWNPLQTLEVLRELDVEYGEGGQTKGDGESGDKPEG